MKTISKTSFNHPFISKKEKVVLGVTLSVDMMQWIVEYYHPLNRPRNNHRLKALERDVRNGDYRSDVGGFIKFDVNGNLIDGQKRIFAHLNMNIPLQVNVHFGLPADAMLYIDRNQPRSIAANVTLAKNVGFNRQPTNEEFSTDRLDYSVAAWCKHGLYWNTSGATKTKHIWTERELMEFVAEKSRMLEFVITDTRTTSRPGVLAAIAIYATKFPQEATKFRNLFYGIDTSPIPVGSPVHTLIEYLGPSSLGGNFPNYNYFNTVRCINAFHAGQNISGAQMSNSHEKFAF